ncbi:hypothetical protein C806_02387 [Lachnospiraceae bacterium 3-1]|nr:hypothetical protein C806_02387 [Lachnospiraceae bacterium 3-1]
MNLFSGLEKFGLEAQESMQLYEEGKRENIKKEEEKEEKAKERLLPKETDFLLLKTIRCKVCEHVFKAKLVKSGKARRLQPDRDLRPRFQYIDTLKYDIISCPACGYTAMSRDFDRITPTQAKMIREQISSRFRKVYEPDTGVYSYDAAIQRYKLSLLNAAVKRGKESEKAYTCLKIAWLYRGKGETMSQSTPQEKEKIAACLKEGEEFYLQAYEGFIKAISQEMFPIYGMDEGTLDYLLAYMSFHFKKYDMASKCLGSVLTSSSASRRLKDMALDLKEEIVSQLKR